MASTFGAQIERFGEKAIRNTELVLKESAQDVFALAQTPVGSSAENPKRAVMGTAPFVEGRIPVDTGRLRNSLQAYLNGSAAGSIGSDSYVLAIGSMRLGDVLRGEWTTNYARHVEYGTSTTPGRYFVRNAALQWQAIVDGNAAKLRE